MNISVNFTLGIAVYCKSSSPKRELMASEAASNAQGINWALPGRLNVRVRSGKKLHDVQYLKFIRGEQDPFVETALVLASIKDLQAVARERQESLVQKFSDKFFGRDTDVSALDEAELVEICLGSSQWQRTRTIPHGGINPVWKDDDFDEWQRSNATYFRFPGRNPAKVKTRPIRLAVRVWDDENFLKRGKIGIGFIALEEVLKQPSKMTLTTCTLKDGHGTIDLEMCFEPWSPLAMRGQLHVSVHEARKLRRVAKLSVEDPFVQAELLPWGIEARTSTIVDGGLHPVWNEPPMSLIYPGLDTDSVARQHLGLGLRLTVYDGMRIRSNRPMGCVWIDVAEVIERDVKRLATAEPPIENKKMDDKDVSITKELMDTKHGVQPCGELTFQLSFKPTYDIIETCSTGTVAVSAGKAKRRALLVGIKYTGSEQELPGCHNDIRKIQTLLQQSFKTTEMRVLMDEDNASQQQLPTSKNIRAGLRWLLEGTVAGDALYVHYSGHGSQVPDEDGDEKDGFDEILVPMDFDGKNPKSYITDDELRMEFFDQIPKGVDVTAVFDCCHSGTISDAKLLRRATRGTSQVVATGTNSQTETESNISSTQHDKSVKSRYLAPSSEMFERMSELQKSRQAPGSTFHAVGAFFKGVSNELTLVSRAQVNTRIKQGSSFVVLSGCKDDQTSMDATFDGQRNGALTWALCKVMQGNMEETITLESFLGQVRQLISSYPINGLDQVPQITLGTAKTGKSGWMEAWYASSAVLSVSKSVPTVSNGDPQIDVVSNKPLNNTKLSKTESIATTSGARKDGVVLTTQTKPKSLDENDHIQINSNVATGNKREEEIIKLNMSNSVKSAQQKPSQTSSLPMRKPQGHKGMKSDDRDESSGKKQMENLSQKGKRPAWQLLEPSMQNYLAPVKDMTSNLFSLPKWKGYHQHTRIRPAGK